MNRASHKKNHYKSRTSHDTSERTAPGALLSRGQGKEHRRGLRNIWLGNKKTKREELNSTSANKTTGQLAQVKRLLMRSSNALLSNRLSGRKDRLEEQCILHWGHSFFRTRMYFSMHCETQQVRKNDANTSSVKHVSRFDT
jgi:hypothetical protein